jgi:hypothetical protein
VTAGIIKVIPDDLACIVDPGGNGVARTQGIVEGGVGTGATGIVEEAVVARGVAVIPDDETRGVDARYNSAAGAEGILERSVVAAAERETVIAGIVEVSPNDLARGVDAGRVGVGA